jgi:hypothetical protein
MKDHFSGKVACFLLVVTGWAFLDFPRSHNLESFAFQDPGFNFSADSLVQRGNKPNVDFGFAYGPLLLILDRAWFAVAGRTPTSYWAAILACNLVMSVALARAARALRADKSGWALLLLMMPMFRGYAILVYGFEPLLIACALAEHASGRRGSALAFLTACLFIKPTMACVYGLLLVIAILRDAWRDPAGGFSRWWRPFLPSVIVGLACLALSAGYFGVQSVVNCFLFPFTEGPAHYRVNQFGFFRGTGGREFLFPVGATFKYYLGSFAGVWVGSSLILLAFAAAAVLRRDGEKQREPCDFSTEVLISCGLMHVAFVTLFYAHAWSWQYYFFVLILGIVAAKGRVAVLIRWLLVLALVLPIVFHTRSTLRFWRSLSPRPAAHGLWASDQMFANWQRIVEAARHTPPAVLSPIGGLEMLEPALFHPPSNLTIYRHYTLPVEIGRKIAEVRAADVVIVHDSSPTGGLLLKEWPEFTSAMADFELEWEHGDVHIYKRRTARPAADILRRESPNDRPQER